MDFDKLIKISDKIDSNYLSNNLENLLILFKYSSEIRGIIKIIDIFKNNKMEDFNHFMISSDFNGEENLFDEKILSSKVVFKQKTKNNKNSIVNDDIAKQIENIFSTFFNINEVTKREITPLYIDIEKKDIPLFLDNFIKHFDLSKKEVFYKSMSDFINEKQNKSILKIDEKNALNKIYKEIQKDSFISLPFDQKSKELLISNIKTLLSVNLYKSFLNLNRIIKRENITQGKIIFNILNKDWSIEMWNEDDKRIAFNFNSYGFQKEIKDENLSSASLKILNKIKKDLVLFADHYNEPYSVGMQHTQRSFIFSDELEFTKQLENFMSKNLSSSDSKILDMFIIEYEKSKLKSALKNKNTDDLQLRKRM